MIVGALNPVQEALGNNPDLVWAYVRVIFYAPTDRIGHFRMVTVTDSDATRETSGMTRECASLALRLADHPTGPFYTFRDENEAPSSGEEQTDDVSSPTNEPTLPPDNECDDVTERTLIPFLENENEKQNGK